MLLAVIIDALTAFVLVMFTIYGSWRGLARSVIGFVGAAVALVGAGYIANALVAPVTDTLVPMVEERVEEKLDLALQTQEAETPGMDENELPAEKLLAMLGLDSQVRDSMAQRAQEHIRETGATVTSAVVNSVAQTIVYGLLYLASFLVLVLLVELLSKVLNGILKLPVLNTANTVGGLLIGLMEGVLLMFLAVWLMRHLGFSFEEGALAHTHILKFFTTTTPLSVLSFLW